MLSSLFLTYRQKFDQLSILVKVFMIIALAGLLVVAWPMTIAVAFGLVVFATMQSPRTRYALAAIMLVPALLMEGIWINTLWQGVDTQPETATKPSQVALVDHENQIQGAKTEQSDQVRVLKALSGDTIEVDQRGQQFSIRLAGIEAPRPGEGANTAECFGNESMMFLSSLLENRMINLVEDTIAGDADDDGNLLRYVRMADGTKVNELMLEAGLAREFTGGDYEQKDIFIELSAAANQQNKGLWASCADDGQPKITPVPSVVVTPTPRPILVEPTGINPIQPEQ